MKANKTFILVSALFCSVIALITVVASKSNNTKLAYVRSAYLVENYKGMKEARDLYQQRISKWQTELDSLHIDYEKSMDALAETNRNISTSQSESREHALFLKRKHLQEFNAILELQLKNRDEILNTDVLNQINSFVEEYARHNGYDIVLGTTASESIMYGDQRMDITEEVLIALNNNYSN